MGERYQPWGPGDLQPYGSNHKFMVLLLKFRLKAARTGREGSLKYSEEFVFHVEGFSLRQ